MPAAIRMQGKRKQPEANLQRRVLQYLCLALPDDAIEVSYPLGGGGYRHGARVKALGAMTGFPDVFVIYRGSIFGLELKNVGKSPSPAQKAAHAKLGRAGMDVRVCRSLDDVQASLDVWGIPIRARVFGFQKQEAA